MSDLIDRRDAIRAIMDLPHCINGYSDTYDKATIVDTLDEVEAVEVEIIRCRDCKNWFKESCPMPWSWTGDNDFCSYGERKES